MKYDNNTIVSAIRKQYRVYQKSIIKKDCFIDGLKINRKQYPIIDHMCGTYFHMITKEKSNIPCCGVKSCSSPNCTFYFNYNPLLKHAEPRQICEDRLDSIPLLKDFFNRPLKIWKKQVTTKKGLRDRILCFDDINNYIIILDDKNGNIKLWSGYPIRYTNRKKQLLKEYNLYISKTNKRHQTSSN